MSTIDALAVPVAPAASSAGAMVSVIVPVYNEQDSVEILYQEIHAVMEAWGRAYEIVFVDDGSRDGSGPILDALANRDSHVTVVHFRRNFGQTAAMSAGIEQSRGEIVVPLDGDLQNDPADIPALVARLEQGFDVVSGWRRHRHDNSVTRLLPSWCANWLISTISGVRLHDYGCTLKAYRRDVVAGVRLYGEMHRFVPIYVHMQGGAIAEMVVNHRPRQFGKSKYGLIRIFKVILDLLLVKFLASYASKPMYLFGGFGLACLVMSLVPIIAALVFKFTPIESMQKDFVETPLPVMAAVLVTGGFLGLLLGILAEMLMRTYFESQGKRPYVLRNVRRCE